MQGKDIGVASAVDQVRCDRCGIEADRTASGFAQRGDCTPERGRIHVF